MPSSNLQYVEMCEVVHVLYGHDHVYIHVGVCVSIQTPVPSEMPEKKRPRQAENRGYQRTQGQGCCLQREGSGPAINCLTIATYSCVAANVLPGDVRG